MCGSVCGYPVSKISLGPLCGSEGSTLILPHVLLSPRIITLCHCSLTMTKNRLFGTLYGNKLPLCVDVPLNTHSFIHSE